MDLMVQVCLTELKDIVIGMEILLKILILDVKLVEVFYVP